MRFVFIITCTFICSFSFSQLYIGEVATHDGFQYMTLEIKKDSTIISFPYAFNQTFDFGFSAEEGKSFTVKARAEQREFVVKNVSTDKIELETKFTGYSQKVTLKRQLVSINESELGQCTGNFIDENGNRVIVYARRDQLYFMSPYTEESASLKPIGKNMFWSTSGETTTFLNNTTNKFQQISIMNRHGKEVKLKRSHEYSVKEDWVMVDGDSIYVNLFIPDLKEKMPACLLLPGGGGQPQMDNAEYEARFFASHGMIAMTFDKVGVGKSKGRSFENYTFQEKAARYLQLFEYLKNHELVDSKKVGLHGPSEGGRLALMMGEKLVDEIAFINATAAPIMTMKEGQLFAVNHYHRNLGVLEEDIVSLNTIWKSYYDGIINEKIDTTNFSLIRELQLKYNRLFIPPTSEIIPISPKKEDLLDNRIVTDANKLVCPVFLQYGENDQRVNPTRSLQNFYQNISDSLDVTVEIYQRGNHSMMTPEYQICPGYAYDKIKWLKSIKIIQ